MSSLPAPDRVPPPRMRVAGVCVSLVPCAGVLLFVANAWFGFPGQMTPDALIAYNEAVSGRYTDVHPPIMARLWSVLQIFGDGPAPLFLLHLGLFWFGLTLIADGLARAGRTGSAMAVLALGLLPPFAYLNLMVLKDVSMVVAWLTAFGLVFWYRVQDREPWPPVAILSVLLCIYGMLTRQNAVFGFAPLLMYAVFPPQRLGVRYLVVGTMVLSVLALPISKFTNTVVLGATSEGVDYNLVALPLFDLTGIAHHANNASYLAPDGSIGLDDVRHCYTPYGFEVLASEDEYMHAGVCSFVSEKFVRYLESTGTDPIAMWLSAIRAEPGAYLAHRLKHFNSATFFLSPGQVIRFRPDLRPDGYAPGTAAPIPAAVRIKDLVVHSTLWSPAVWIVVGSVLLLGVARLPSARAAQVLLVSALGFSMAYLIVGLTTTKRHNYWTLLAVMIVTILCAPLVAERLRKRDRWAITGVIAVAAVATASLLAQLLDFSLFVY